jgi:hypothetical protein
MTKKKNHTAAKKGKGDDCSPKAKITIKSIPPRLDGSCSFDIQTNTLVYLKQNEKNLKCKHTTRFIAKCLLSFWKIKSRNFFELKLAYSKDRAIVNHIDALH